MSPPFPVFALLLILAALLCVPREAAAWTKAEWLRDAFLALTSSDFPRLKAMSYWHESWQDDSGVTRDLRIDSSDESLAAYRESVAHASFVSMPRFVQEGGRKILAPPGSGLYLSAFPDFSATEDEVTADAMNDFETLSGRLLTWAYFSDNWFDGIRFPSASVKTILDSGRLPFIRIMMRGRLKNGEPEYSLQSVLDGDYDVALARWAEAARDVKSPLAIELGTEVNGDWFPWSGAANGGGTLDGFGSPTVADGPERFQEVYRKFVKLFRQKGATNVTWFFHVDAKSSPREPWNTMAAYYPGDAYVDWLGLSVYGPTHSGESYVSFSRRMQTAYKELSLVSLSKPIAVLEMGVGESGQ